jgi:hypothetical protein
MYILRSISGADPGFQVRGVGGGLNKNHNHIVFDWIKIIAV